MNKTNSDIEIALLAARAGADVIRQKFGNSSDARVKGEAKGIVTDTDLASERAIIDILKKHSPHNILSEESGLLRDEPGKKWIIDPLDGTSNFARGIPFFAVSVGLMGKNDFIAGVIIDPVSGNEYYAVKGEGAFCNGERISISPLQKGFTPCIYLNHGYSVADRNKFIQLTNKLAVDYDILKPGATALELCYVATGAIDSFICSGDALWDFAAGVVIATEAGAVFSNWQGKSWNEEKNELLITRPEIYDDLLRITKNLS